MCEHWFACKLHSKAHSSETAPRDAEVTQVLELLFKSNPPQNCFAGNPPGKQHVAESTLGLVGYAGKVFLKKDALPWDKTKHVVRLLSTWRDLKLGIKCETDGRAGIINMDSKTRANTGLTKKGLLLQHSSFVWLKHQHHARPEVQKWCRWLLQSHDSEQRNVTSAAGSLATQPQPQL